jgi:hypothetical protein
MWGAVEETSHRCGLFHTFNTLNRADRKLVLSSDRPPKAMAQLEERLQSRFEWGLIADIQPPGCPDRLPTSHLFHRQQSGAAPLVHHLSTHSARSVIHLLGAASRSHPALAPPGSRTRNANNRHLSVCRGPGPRPPRTGDVGGIPTGPGFPGHHSGSPAGSQTGTTLG